MSGDVQLVGTTALAGAQSRIEAQATASARAVASPQTASLPAAVPAQEQSPQLSALPNPRLHTDLALNRLVLEFFNAQGALTNSIPSQKQLEAYRLAAFSGNTQNGANRKP